MVMKKLVFVALAIITLIATTGCANQYSSESAIRIGEDVLDREIVDYIIDRAGGDAEEVIRHLIRRGFIEEPPRNARDALYSLERQVGTTGILREFTHIWGTEYVSRYIHGAPNQPTPQQDELMVWIPRTGQRYHSRANCSNMRNPSHVTVTLARELGYTRCSRCW